MKKILITLGTIGTVATIASPISWSIYNINKSKTKGTGTTILQGKAFSLDTNSNSGIKTPSLSQNVVVGNDKTNDKVEVLNTSAKNNNKISKVSTTIAKPFDFKTDLAKIIDVSSAKVAADLKAAVGSKSIGQDVNAVDLGITNSNLTNGVMASYTVKKVYQDAVKDKDGKSLSSASIVVAVVLTKNGEKSASKNIKVTPTFVTTKAESNWLNGMTPGKSSKYFGELKSLIGNKKAGDGVTLNELGIYGDYAFAYQPYLKVFIKKPYNSRTGEAIVTIKMFKDGMTSSKGKDIKVSAKSFYFGTDLMIFNSINGNSYKYKNQLAATVESKKVGDVLSSQDLGLLDFVVTKGVTSRFVVKTPYNKNTGTIVVTAGLEKDGERSSSVVRRITGRKFPFASEDAQLQDFNSSKSKSGLQSSLASKSVNDAVTTDELGIPNIKLSSGVQISYVVKNAYDSNTGKITVTATLRNKRLETYSKDVTVRRTTAQEDVNALLLKAGPLFQSDVFKNAALRDKTSSLIVKFIQGGLNGVTLADVDSLLTALNVSDKTKKLIYPLFTKTDLKNPTHKVIDLRLADAVFNKGLATLKGSERTATIKSFQTILASVLPKGISLSDKLIEDLLFKGFANKEKFVDETFAVLSKIPQLKSVLDNLLAGGFIKGIISDVLASVYDTFDGALKDGLLNMSVEDLKQIINWDGLLSVSHLGTYLSLANSVSGGLPDGAGDIIKKVVVTNDKLDVLQTARNFLAKEEIVPAGWTTFDKVMKVWDFLKTLNKSNSIDTLLTVVPTVLQKGVGHLTSKQANQLANMVDFVADYDVEITKSSSDKLKKAIIKSFEGKFADAKNTKVIDLSALNDAKNIKEFVNIAKKTIVFNAQKVYKKAIVVPRVEPTTYFDPAKTLADYKDQLIDKLGKLYLSKEINQKHVTKALIKTVKDAKTIKIVKQIVDKFNKDGLYTKYFDSRWGYWFDDYGVLTTVNTKVPAFDDLTPAGLTKYKKTLESLFKDTFSDDKLKNPISVDAIANAKNIPETFAAFAKLSKSVYTGFGTKFTPDINGIVKSNPVVMSQYKQSTIDQFKQDALNALANLFADKAHSVNVDTTRVSNANTVKEIQAAFSTLTSGTLYDASGQVVTTKLVVNVPAKDGVPSPLTADVLKQTTHGVYGNIISAAYKEFPELNDFLFNGISNMKGDKTKLNEFVSKRLMTLFQTILPTLKGIDLPSMKEIKTVIEENINPIITKISEMN